MCLNPDWDRQQALTWNSNTHHVASIRMTSELRNIAKSSHALSTDVVTGHFHFEKRKKNNKLQNWNSQQHEVIIIVGR